MLDIIINIILIAAALVVCFCIAVELVKLRTRREDAISGDGGIDEMLELHINAAGQWINLRGRDAKNPVLLVLHGGPGNPLMPFAHMFCRELEEHFVVCQYDQRCAGKSYESGMAADITPTLDLMADDCLHVTMYLKERFGCEKILLLCHSWGTVLGTTLIRRYPQHYRAYIGIGQLVDFIKNERICYDTVLADARLRGDDMTIRELEEIAPYPEENRIPAHKAMIMRRHSTGYNLRYSGIGSEVKGAVHMVRGVLESPEYTLRDTTAYAHNLFDTYRGIFERDLAAYSVYDHPLEFFVPMYFISGANDCLTPYRLSKEFFEAVRCPDKQFYTVAGSGHSPMLDHTRQFEDIMLNDIWPRICNFENGGLL